MKIEILRLPGKNPMLSYTANTEHEAIALSAGVKKADTMHNLRLFHQIGSFDLVGFHGWEIWNMRDLEDRHLEVICDYALSEANKFFKRIYGGA